MQESEHSIAQDFAGEPGQGLVGARQQMCTDQRTGDQELPPLVSMIIDRTQQAMEAASTAAAEAEWLLTEGTLRGTTLEQQQHRGSHPCSVEKYLAAEAAMASAEQALSMAMKLLQDTQQLVASQHILPSPAGAVTHAAAAPTAIPGALQQPQQQQQQQQHQLMMMMTTAMPAQELLDPDLQDTCDSLASTSASLSAFTGGSSCPATTRR